MKRGRRLRYALALISPCLLATGCLAYAYPKVFYVPGCDPGPKVAGVRAFRVDVIATLELAGETSEYTLTEIESRADGTFPTQTSMTLERGFYTVGVSLNSSIGRFHTTLVRLYRPGYQLIELKSWDLPGAIQWRPAPEVDGQEKAIDDLLRRPLVTALGTASLATPAGAQIQAKQLPADSTPQAKNSLVFAAAEYRRVAALAKIPADVTRLREKSHRLMESKQASAEPIIPESSGPSPHSP